MQLWYRATVASSRWMLVDSTYLSASNQSLDASRLHLFKCIQRLDATVARYHSCTVSGPIKITSTNVLTYKIFWSYLQGILGRAPTVGGTFKPVPQPRLEVSARTGRHRFSQQMRFPCYSNGEQTQSNHLKRLIKFSLYILLFCNLVNNKLFF